MYEYNYTYNKNESRQRLGNMWVQRTKHTQFIREEKLTETQISINFNYKF